MSSVTSREGRVSRNGQKQSERHFSQVTSREGRVSRNLCTASRPMSWTPSRPVRDV